MIRESSTRTLLLTFALLGLMAAAPAASAGHAFCNAGYDMLGVGVVTAGFYSGPCAGVEVEAHSKACPDLAWGWGDSTWGLGGSTPCEAGAYVVIWLP